MPAPISVPSPTRTGRSLFIARARSKAPLPRKKFEVGQWAIAAPLACSALQLGLLQPDAVAEHRAVAAQAMVIVDVEIVAAIGEQFPDPGDLVPVLGDVGLHQALGMLRHSPPAAASCSGELVPAKRGVMA